MEEHISEGSGSDTNALESGAYLVGRNNSKISRKQTLAIQTKRRRKRNIVTQLAGPVNNVENVQLF